MTFALRSLIVLIGLLFAVEATRFAFVEDLIRQNLYEEALDWRAGSTDALTKSAEVELGLGDARGAGGLAIRAVTRAPLDVAALRIAGLAFEAGNDDNQTQGETIMRQAMLVGWRDAPTQYWVFKTALQRSDWSAAAVRADAMARANWHRDQILAALWALTAEPAAIPGIARQLAASPNWRTTFFHDSGISANRSDAGFLALSALLAKTPAPVTDDERASYIQGLVGGGFYARARALWVAALPAASRPANALISDPDFAMLAARGTSDHGSDFEWDLRSPSRAPVTVSRRGNRTSIEIDTSGTNHGRVLSQTLALAPGNYRLIAQVQNGHADALSWHMLCLPAKSALVKQAPLSEPLTFSVPPGCEGQALSVTAGPPATVLLNSVQLTRN